MDLFRRARCLRVHSFPRGFTRVRLGVIGFIRVDVSLLGRSQVSSVSFVFAWVHYGVPSGRLVHSRLRGLTRAHPVVVGLIRDPVSSLRRALVWSGSFGIVWVQSGRPKSRRVLSDSRGFTVDGPRCLRFHSGLRGLTRERLVVVRFIWVREGSRGCTWGSFGSFGFVWVHSQAPSGRRVYPVSPVLLGYIGVHVGEPWGRRVHSCSRGLTRAGLGVFGSFA